MKVVFATAAAAAVALWAPGASQAHGFAGKRFFPATIATEDPFVADELSLPTVGQRRLGATDEGPGARQTRTAVDFTKRITPNFGVGIGANYLRLRDPDGSTSRGFDNWAAGLKYQSYKNDPHEAIASIGLDWDIGGTGAKSVGAESFSTYTPAVFLGKGMGDLPESLKYLRPLAVTGVAGLRLPSRASSPDILHLGFAVEYSVPYLQSFVKDIGLSAPFSRMMPVVEFDLQKPVDRAAGGWVGTANPGIIFAGRYMQLGLEAVLPVNSRTGGGKGILFQLHFFLDDLFPRTLGRPLF